MSLSAHVLAERAVPRYTSYPTAPHFKPAVNGEVYAGWLKALPAESRLSLYLHVPFCRDLCHYCGCHTQAMRKREPVDDYAEVLRAEIAAAGRDVPGGRVTHVHWGGGTPSMLGPAQLQAVWEKICGSFEVTADCEHAIELDPRYVSDELAAALARMRVSRTSFGVQELSDHVQRAIGRVQPYETVARAVTALQTQGITDINFDLMYGLPQQTVADVRASAARSCELRPQRFALFGYAHVPWFKKRQRLIDPADLPGAMERLEQMRAARDVFLANGYVEIGFDHFALPDDTLAAAARAGGLRRNFQGYTADDADALLGFGASAIGRLPQGYVQNAPDIGGYARAILGGSYATVRGLALTDDDRTRAAIIERLMCDLGVDLHEFAGDAPAFATERKVLEPLAAEGLVHIEGDQIRVTEAGRPFVRLVAAAFDAYLPNSSAAHSRAV